MTNCPFKVFRLEQLFSLFRLGGGNRSKCSLTIFIKRQAKQIQIGRQKHVHKTYAGSVTGKQDIKVKWDTGHNTLQGIEEQEGLNEQTNLGKLKTGE